MKFFNLILISATLIGSATSLPNLALAQSSTKPTQQRQERRQDMRQERRQDMRQDQRQERRQDMRQDQRQERRQDMRQDQRQERRQDMRQDQRQGIPFVKPSNSPSTPVPASVPPKANS